MYHVVAQILWVITVEFVTISEGLSALECWFTTPDQRTNEAHEEFYVHEIFTMTNKYRWTLEYFLICARYMRSNKSITSASLLFYFWHK